MYKNSENISPSCSSSEGLVAYLYGEMTPAEQSAFEGHLEGCDACTAEFAELSLSRLAVYEWHRDEFTQLATPRIVIRYDEPARASWIDAFRSLLSLPTRIGMAAAAVLMVALATGIWLLGPDQLEVARQDEQIPSPVQVENETNEVEAAVSPDPGPGKTDRVEKPAQSHEARPKAITLAAGPSRRSPQRPVRPQSTPVTSVVAVRTGGSPRLNKFVDEEDTTLRLGDLLADIDYQE